MDRVGWLLPLWIVSGCGTSESPAVHCPLPVDGSADGPFAPSEQTALFERGLVLPEFALPCVPVSTGVPQNECNHHASTVAQLADGAIATVWYHGEAEKSVDSRLVWSRRAADGAWTAPEVVFDEPDRAEGNPTIWVHEDGDIFVFFVTIFGTTWDESRIRLTRSSDGGASWSPPVMLREEPCWNARHRPLRLDSGELLLPLYEECLALPTFMRSPDDFATSSEISTVDHLELIGQIQPALIHGADGAVLAITRDGTETRRIRRLRSDDGGRTWSDPEPLALPNSGTSVDWVRLANGHVVVVFNNHPQARFPLSVALSYDDGASFVAVRDLLAECNAVECSYAYPSILQDANDGSLWVTYTHDRRTIGWVHFNEAWLSQGTELARIRCGTFETCVDGACFKTCTDAAECATDEQCIDGACRRACTEGPSCNHGVCPHPSAARCEP